jgi:hypothetical protein
VAGRSPNIALNGSARLSPIVFLATEMSAELQNEMCLFFFHHILTFDAFLQNVVNSAD